MYLLARGVGDVVRSECFDFVVHGVVHGRDETRTGHKQLGRLRSFQTFAVVLVRCHYRKTLLHYFYVCTFRYSTMRSIGLLTMNRRTTPEVHKALGDKIHFRFAQLKLTKTPSHFSSILNLGKD